MFDDASRYYKEKLDADHFWGLKEVEIWHLEKGLGINFDKIYMLREVLLSIKNGKVPFF